MSHPLVLKDRVPKRKSKASYQIKLLYWKMIDRRLATERSFWMQAYTPMNTKLSLLEEAQKLRIAPKTLYSSFQNITASIYWQRKVIFVLVMILWTLFEESRSEKKRRNINRRASSQILTLRFGPVSVFLYWIYALSRAASHIPSSSVQMFLLSGSIPGTTRKARCVNANCQRMDPLDVMRTVSIGKGGHCGNMSFLTLDWHFLFIEWCFMNATYRRALAVNCALINASNVRRKSTT